MILNEDSIKAYHEVIENPKEHGLSFPKLSESFVELKTCTAKHILAKQYMEVCPNCPKVMLLMDRIFGNCNGKDERGNLGYFLEFKKV